MSSDHRTRNIGNPYCAAIKTFAIMVCFFAMAVSQACGGASTSTTSSTGNGGGPVAARVSGTISAGTNPIAIAVDSTNNKIYVANFGKDPNNGICQTCYCPGVNGTLTVIDGATQVPTTSAFSYAYQNPFDLAVNSAKHNLYVVSRVFLNPSNPTCGYAGELDAIDTTTSSEMNTSYVGHAVAGERIAVNQNTGNAYVTDWYDGTVTVLDASGIVLNTITLLGRPSGIAVNQTTNKIYVTASVISNTGSTNEVIVIDGATSSVVNTVTDPRVLAAGAVAVNPTTNMIYVANGNGCSTCQYEIAAIDDASGSVKVTIPVGTNPAAVAVDSQTNFIYVANAGNFDFNQPGSVTAIDGMSNTATTLTDPNLHYPISIAVNPATNKIYVANILSSNVTVINGAHN